MKEILVSVIIPTYNRESTIERAVRSVLNQSYQNLELIVVDDCSTDNTKMVIESISDPRLRYFCLEKNSGACVARNKGIEISNGEIIAFQDSDDEWLEYKLEKQLKYMISRKLDFITCPFFRCEGGDKKVVGECECPDNNTDVWCKLLYEGWISTQTIVCYRKCFDTIAFDKNIKRYQDWDLGLQAAMSFRLGVLNEPLVNVYLQNDSITNVQPPTERLLQVLDKHKTDIDWNNKKMISAYYYVYASIEKKVDMKKAGKDYWISFKAKPTLKKIVQVLFCSLNFKLFYGL